MEVECGYKCEFFSLVECVCGNMYKCTEICLSSLLRLMNEKFTREKRYLVEVMLGWDGYVPPTYLNFP